MALLILVLALDSPHYRTRDAATECLSRIACPSLLPLLEHVEREGNPEAAARCRHVLGRWWSANGARVAAGMGKMPWIAWHAECPYPMSYDLLVEARKTAKKGGPDWAEYRQATRLLVARRLSERLPVADLLRELWEEEARWKLENKRP